MNMHLVRIGHKTYCIRDATWNSAEQLAMITFEDDNGITQTVTGWGMSMQEQRQAVYDAVLADDPLVRFAKTCGNHPYEDG